MLREKWTLEPDKEMALDWEKYLLEIARNKELLEVEPIKNLLKGLLETINEISFLLAFDEESLDEKKRRTLFERRASYIFILEFFTGNDEILKSIEANINKEFEA